VAYVDMGAILMQQEQYKDALTALRRAVVLDPAQPDAHYRLGLLYRTPGNTAAAQAEFNKVLELHERADETVASKTSGSPAFSN
jgi:Flp pilus assembly protein TadD